MQDSSLENKSNTRNFNVVDNNTEVDENFYGYDDFNNNNNDDRDKKNNKKKKIILFIVLFLIFLVSVAIIVFLLVGNNNDNPAPTPTPIPSITLSATDFELNVGSSKNITYTVENDNGNVVVTWSSSDKSVATVTENGTVKGIKDGSAIITASYTIDGVEYKETCSIKVKKKQTTQTKDTTDPKLSYTITSGKANTWVNTDVSIKVTASDNSGSVTVKYTTNCNSNCKYTTVSKGVIKISSTGSSVVRIIATDKAGNSTEQKVNVMIDKTKPNCSLEVSGINNLSAKYNDIGSGISYYGFSSSYSGTSGNSQTLKKAGTYTYYVKDKVGNTGTCSLEIGSKTQYRYQECTSCKTCEAAGCESRVWGWEVLSQGNLSVSNSCSVTESAFVIGDYRYTGCTNNTPTATGSCRFTCEKKYEKVWRCNTYKASCDACGCNSWANEFSAWSDTKYTETTSRKVETRNVYYSVNK